MSILKQIQEALHRHNEERLIVLLAKVVKATGDGRSEVDTLYFTIMNGFHKLVDAAVLLITAQTNQAAAAIIADILKAGGDERPKEDLAGFVEMALAKLDGKSLEALESAPVPSTVPTT